MAYKPVPDTKSGRDCKDFKGRFWDTRFCKLSATCNFAVQGYEVFSTGGNLRNQCGGIKEINKQ